MVRRKAPLSTELSSFTQALLSEPIDYTIEEIEAITDILKTQRKFQPYLVRRIIDWCSSKEGRHSFVFSFAGRHINEGLAILSAWRLSRTQKDTFKVWANDYGFEILSLGKNTDIRELASP